MRLITTKPVISRKQFHNLSYLFFCPLLTMYTFTDVLVVPYEKSGGKPSPFTFTSS